jgi:NADPH:quinone reductase-like Zn-dependent oxidoreductase
MAERTMPIGRGEEKGVEAKRESNRIRAGHDLPGPLRVHVDQKPMPEVLHPQDALVRVTRSCICGSNLHLYNGDVPDTRAGMTFGQGSTGVVEELDDEVKEPKVGDLGLLPGHELLRTPTVRNS